MHMANENGKMLICISNLRNINESEEMSFFSPITLAKFKNWDEGRGSILVTVCYNYVEGTFCIAD